MGRTGPLLLVLLLAGGGAAWWLLRDDAPSLDERPDAAAQDVDPDDDLAPALAVTQERASGAPPRDVRITVVEGSERTPVVGATVAVERIATPVPAPTNAAGRTWVRGVPGNTSFRIEVQRAGGLSRPVAARIGSRSRGHTIELPRVRTVSFEVLDTPEPRPAAGTSIRITRAPNPKSKGTYVTLDGNRLVIEGCGDGPFRAWAYAPDGRSAELRCARRQDVGVPIVFRTSRTLHVRVRYDDGSAASDTEIELYQDVRAGALRTQHTDTAGVALFSGVPPGQYTARAYHDGAPLPAIRGGKVDFDAGHADLTKADGAIEARVARPRVYHIQLKGLKNAKALSSARVSVDGRLASVEPAPGGRLHATWYRVDTREPSELTLRLSGSLPVTVPLPQSAPTGPQRLTITLRPAARFRVVTMPTGMGLTKVRLERRDDEGRWIFADRELSQPHVFRGPDRFNPNRNGMLVDDVPPGTYRVVVPDSQVVSNEVQATLDGPAPTATIDLGGGVRVIEGRVQLPPRASPIEVRLLLHPHEDAAVGDEPRVAAQLMLDGTFRLRVPRGRTMVLTAAHPIWRPPDGAGPVLVDDDTHSIEIELVKRPVQRIRLDGDFGKLPRAAGVMRSMPIAYVRTDDERRAVVQRGTTRVIGAMVTFLPPPETGIYEVFFDAAPFAPIHLKNIGFGERTQWHKGGKASYLPHKPVPLGRGGTVRFELPATMLAPALFVTATHLGVPAYVRDNAKKGGVTLSGLGPGRFRITLRSRSAPNAKPIWAGEVESDGATESLVTVPN